MNSDVVINSVPQAIFLFFHISLMLVGAHYFGDFAFQGDWMSANKVPGMPVWRHVLFAHSVIHGVLVAICTTAVLGIVEIFLHFGIDYLKGMGKISFRQDQYLHLACKAVYFVVMALCIVKYNVQL